MASSVTDHYAPEHRDAAHHQTLRICGRIARRQSLVLVAPKDPGSFHDDGPGCRDLDLDAAEHGAGVDQHFLAPEGSAAKINLDSAEHGHQFATLKRLRG